MDETRRRLHRAMNLSRPHREQQHIARSPSVAPHQHRIEARRHHRRIAATQGIAARHLPHPAGTPQRRRNYPDAIEPMKRIPPVQPEPGADQRQRCCRNRIRRVLIHRDSASAGRSPADAARRESSRHCRTAPHRWRSSCRTPRSSRPRCPPLPQKRAPRAASPSRRPTHRCPATAPHCRRRTSVAGRLHRPPPPAHPRPASPPARPPTPPARTAAAPSSRRGSAHRPDRRGIRQTFPPPPHAPAPR
ncbi:hypothetical protein WR25_00934 [Diploscapter pachys]|uniref:Uncharacterized protein n=1 Tax=Diploscapter pachys TaxID=2018661 RepID=A0A2A2K1V7_9BILA|nr:hypothetical protein WR25_00934 [Diploscapter pachys]